MTIAIIDCYDSFTFNLVHYLEQLCTRVDVFRNDSVFGKDLTQYNGIVLSPGPGLPKETENLFDIIDTFGKSTPILGICLGHQAIAQFFGCELVNIEKPLHGISVPISIEEPNDPLFIGIPAEFETGRYHSWAVNHFDSHPNLKSIAVDKFGYSMAISHNELPIKSVQFHPESILTPYGFKLLSNWVNYLETLKSI